MRSVVTYLFCFSLVVNHFEGYSQQMFSVEALNNPKDFSAFFESTIPIREVGIFDHNVGENQVLLENGYALAILDNSEDWPPQGLKIRPTSVEIIFTKYPKDKSFWLTNYHWLLAKRLENLFSIDASLNDQSIKYSIILQTDCEDELEAMQLFHGIRVTYEPIVDRERIEPLIDQKAEEIVPTSLNEEQVRAIRRYMIENKYVMDSTVFNAFERNPTWKNATVVVDWTGSMYGYGAEALLWHVNQADTGKRRFILFNDGDGKGSKRKKIGSTGGIHPIEMKSTDYMLRQFDRVKRKGDGGDSPENDVEAMLAAINDQPDLKEVVLIADNGSCIRDYLLLGNLGLPIHIVLCDTRKGVNHQYVNLAWKTGGSIHTNSEDITNLQALIQQDSLSIDGVSFTLTEDLLLMPSDRNAYTFRSCDKYYRKKYVIPRMKKSTKEECSFTE